MCTLLKNGVIVALYMKLCNFSIISINDMEYRWEHIGNLKTIDMLYVNNFDFKTISRCRPLVGLHLEIILKSKLNVETSFRILC